MTREVEELLGCATSDGLTERLGRLADWYESGPSYPRDFEEGRQRIAADLRAALAALSTRTPTNGAGAREISERARELLAAEFESRISNELRDNILAGKDLTIGQSMYIFPALRAIESALSTRDGK